MRIVIAMDSFKDSLTAVKACEIVTQALRSLVQEAVIVVKPMADGGESTAMVATKFAQKHLMPS